MGKVIKKLKEPITNPKTDRSHSAWLQTLVATVCALLIKFGWVSPETLDGEATAQMIIVLGIVIMLWRTYVAPRWNPFRK